MEYLELELDDRGEAAALHALLLLLLGAALRTRSGWVSSPSERGRQYLHLDIRTPLLGT